MVNAKNFKIIKTVIDRHIPKEYKVFVFGSRAKNTNRKYSDIDLGIKGRKKLDTKKLGMVMADLEASNLPYKVDVVDFKRIGNSFINKVLSGKILWIRN